MSPIQDNSFKGRSKRLLQEPELKPEGDRIRETNGSALSYSNIGKRWNIEQALFSVKIWSSGTVENPVLQMSEDKGSADEIMP